MTLKPGAIRYQEKYWHIIHQMKSLKENWIISIKQLKCSSYYCNLRDIIISQAPMIKENFPLIETSEQRLGRTLLCSAYLLKDGTLVKVYMPKYYTLRELTGALNRNDKIPLSNGILVHARDIAAIVNE
mgnify:CR=1 FL=1